MKIQVTKNKNREMKIWVKEQISQRNNICDSLDKKII